MPLLELDDGRCLSESNAIVTFLAEGSALMPTDAFARAKVQQWQFFEQYSHEPNVATMRFWLHYVGEANLSPQQKAQMMAKRIAGCEALALMDAHLAARDWFVGEGITLADLPEPLATPAPTLPVSGPTHDTKPAAPRERLLAQLRERHWNIAHVARDLDVARSTVYRRMARLGIVDPKYRH